LFTVNARNLALSVTDSLSECWQLWITDYGVVPSVFAAFAIAALLFVLFVMLRSSISPRRTRKMSFSADRKKKKRKGSARHRSGKSKLVISGASRSRSMSCEPPADSSLEQHRSLHDENAPDLAPLTPVSSQRHLMVSCEQEHNDSLPLHNIPKTAVGSLPRASLTKSSTLMLDTSLSARSLLPSLATVDGTVSDDMSCSSKSILSLPSVGTGSAKSTESLNVSTFRTIPSNKSNSDNQTPNLTSHRSKNSDNATERATSPTGSESGSRWDALKPRRSPRNHVSHHDRQSPAKSSEKQLRHRPIGPNRAQTRKSTRTGSVGSRSHLGGQQTPTRTQQVTGFPSNRLPERSLVSPPALEHGHAGSFYLPPPPPGLGPIMPGLVSEMNTCLRFPSPRPPLSTSFESLPNVPASDLPTCSWKLPTDSLRSGSSMPTFLEHRSDQYQPRTTDSGASLFDSPNRVAHFPGSPPHVVRLGTGVVSVKDNPFASDLPKSDEQIEADLQALGGQMAGSILDF
jgi:hypothetical protein